MSDNGNTALATRQQQETALTTPQHFNWSADDITLIRNTVARGASDSEFKLLLYQAQRYGLDPLVREIWCVKNSNRPEDPAQIFAGRDGFLAIAHRNEQFDGMDETEAIYEDGKLVAARATVWRKDMSHPFVVSVRRSEYDTGRSNWSRMPETMLKKVAECQALRKAFNIHGVYDPDEVRGGATAPEESAASAARPVATVITQQPKKGGPKMQEYNRLIDAMTTLGVPDADVALLFALHNRTGMGGKEMTIEQYKEIVAEIISTYSSFEQVEAALGVDEAEEGEFEEEEI